MNDTRVITAENRSIPRDTRSGKVLPGSTFKASPKPKRGRLAKYPHSVTAFACPDTLKPLIDAEAERRGVNRSEFIRSVLTAELDSVRERETEDR